MLLTIATAIALKLLSLGAPLLGAQTSALPLPCPSDAGWELVRELELPRRGRASEPIGGFSALLLDGPADRLWLLSDLPQGSIGIWSGLEAALAGAAPLRLERTVPLRSGLGQTLPPKIDAEGMVRLGGQLWVASEGRRDGPLPAQLLRFEASSGLLLQALELPSAWQPGQGRGLGSNAGPESLALLDAVDGKPALLMAAEQPLLQDPPRQVRLLRWGWRADQDPRVDAPEALEQGSLLLPSGDGWGLTELLVLDSGQLLALLRRFEPPFSWQIQLALYPLPAATDEAAAPPLAQWDLIAAGLSPDNWEGLIPGPPLADGRPTLLLLSDDNLNPLQANRLAQLAPLHPQPPAAQEWQTDQPGADCASNAGAGSRTLAG
ncbi:esterase-like activity of phytase family protein [Cyanobium sp. LEGE 06113]|uniref:esterase-like activity of phytase family protein n=1 Tax=Cyanobium sp. LEGE 06113 TaxID=1297573 RepID=UPI00351C7B06